MGSTALKQFQRLEAPGSWRPAPGEQLREVVVSIGEATLILSDPKSDEPLTHWSLPAVERINHGQMPALYTPASDQDSGYETLEIEDQWMIDAISRVQTVIAARRPHPGRLRGGIMLAALAAMIVAAAIWLPPALRSHAVRITPPAERERIGQALLTDMLRATGQPCQDATAGQVLRGLSRRIALPENTQIFVLRDGLQGALILPGGITVVDNALIAGQDGPEALAGHLLAARIAAEQVDPLAQIMKRADFGDVLGLLTRGTMPQDATRGFGEELLAERPLRPTDQQLLQGFEQARIPASPYAATLPGNEGPHVPLTEADPFKSQPYPPILSERDWVALQQICVGDS
ncbi:hypothetical protein [Paracoccus aerodenitrificans]|uniref:hypothetical protein n=1 Tax=Paracoccus aerodenitrificans TaxID=3017781 RepID=UPI0022F0061C|nr:hypothetical protein [Paracoccus aerodenitrificans]WBU64468.1 hypothetical protein PAE61_03215 [Paracoccus aerodenitrificans]